MNPKRSTTENTEDTERLGSAKGSVFSAFSVSSVVNMLCLLAMVLPGGVQPGTAQTRRPDVRFLATPQNVVDAMLDLAQVTASDVVYDLGSGDGRIPITAARRFGARGVGIEIDPTLVRESEANARKAGVEQSVRFVAGDLFEADICDATVVTLFLMPGINIDLIPKFKAQLRPGTRIVSHHFAMSDRWLPDETRDVNGLEIFLWRVP